MTSHFRATAQGMATTPAYTITEYTRDFARKAGGYIGESPAMLEAFEKLRRAGISQARAAHFERKRVIDEMAETPVLFFHAIRPSLSTSEAIEDATRFIASYCNMPTWRQENRTGDLLRAKEKRVLGRYFRRFGRRLWVRDAT